MRVITLTHPHMLSRRYVCLRTGAGGLRKGETFFMQHNHSSEAIIVPFVEPERLLLSSQRPGSGPSPDQSHSRVIFLQPILHTIFPPSCS
jgi:hypothetical protein